jgi:hypothetical protein
MVLGVHAGEWSALPCGSAAPPPGTGRYPCKGNEKHTPTHTHLAPHYRLSTALVLIPSASAHSAERRAQAQGKGQTGSQLNARQTRAWALAQDAGAARAAALQTTNCKKAALGLGPAGPRAAGGLAQPRPVCCFQFPMGHPTGGPCGTQCLQITKPHAATSRSPCAVHTLDACWRWRRVFHRWSPLFLSSQLTDYPQCSKVFL